MIDKNLVKFHSRSYIFKTIYLYIFFFKNKIVRGVETHGGIIFHSDKKSKENGGKLVAHEDTSYF